MNFVYEIDVGQGLGLCTQRLNDRTLEGWHISQAEQTNTHLYIHTHTYIRQLCITQPAPSLSHNLALETQQELGTAGLTKLAAPSTLSHSGCSLAYMGWHSSQCRRRACVWNHIALSSNGGFPRCFLFRFFMGYWASNRQERDFEKRQVTKQLSGISLAQHGNILVAGLDATRAPDIEGMCYMKVALSSVLK